MVDMIRVSLVVATVLLVLHALTSVYALSTNGWLQTKTSTTGSESVSRLAPFFYCPATSGQTIVSCGDYEPFEVVYNDCKVTEDDNRGFMILIRVFTISPGAFSLVGSALALSGLVMDSSSIAIRIVPAVVFSILALICNAVGIAFTIINFNKILCDSPCFGVDDCKESWQISAWIFFCSAVFPTSAAILLIVRGILGPSVTPPNRSVYAERNAEHNNHSQEAPREMMYRPESPQQQQHQQHQQNGGSPRAYGQQQHAAVAVTPITRSPPRENDGGNFSAIPPTNVNDYSVAEMKKPPTALDGPVHPNGFELPEGDWQWDPASSMYWSESQYLFLNPLNSHFYDPNSNHWYNAETETWFPADTE